MSIPPIDSLTPPHNRSASGEFREDINGLRALAVMLVVFFHFDLLGLTGGYLGVDVFYVISGYLMTRIVLRGLENDAFALLTFYAGRARRIIPALAVLCVAVLCVGWFWLMPSDYAMLAEHAASSVGFYSNFVYQGEEGYFDTPSQYKWLLHTWSLSVEWQFYMLYPLLLMLLAKFTGGPKSRGFAVALWLLAAASLLLSAASSADHASFAFFLLPTRIWELMAGALVFLHLRDGMTNRAAAPWLEIVGIAMILLPAFVLTDESTWPGWYALAPVLGTAFVLVAARHRSWLTGPVVFQKLGLWSYSIYLWHWPVIVALGHFYRADDPAWRAGGIALSLLLGWVSYRFIEQPFRVSKSATPRRILGYAVLGIGVVMGAGMAISLNKGVPGRVSEAVLAVERATHLAPDGKPLAGKKKCSHLDKDGTVTPCILGNPKNIKYAVWGDSHARVLAPIVLKAAGEGAGVAQFTTQCVTIFNAQPASKTRHNCPAFNEAVLKAIAALPPEVEVVVQNRYALHLHGSNEGVMRNFGIIYRDEPDTKESQDDLYRRKLPESLCRIAKTRKLYAVRPVPEMGEDVPRKVGRLLMAGLPVENISIPRAEYDTRNAVAQQALDAAAEQCGVTLLDPTQYLCDAEKCIGSKDGKPLYVDDDHLNEFGSDFLIEMFEKAFAR